MFERLRYNFYNWRAKRVESKSRNCGDQIRWLESNPPDNAEEMGGDYASCLRSLRQQRQKYLQRLSRFLAKSVGRS
ncbi:MAG: hypothetical protein KKF56_01805 [Nanoarchaeota archaeon]|nr:hypothetical protein [Nanoarchaeota archaeon]